MRPRRGLNPAKSLRAICGSSPQVVLMPGILRGQRAPSRGCSLHMGMRKARTSPMRAIPKKERRCIQWPVKGILSVHFYNYIISLVEVGFPGPVSSISSAFP